MNDGMRNSVDHVVDRALSQLRIFSIEDFQELCGLSSGPFCPTSWIRRRRRRMHGVVLIGKWIGPLPKRRGDICSNNVGVAWAID